MKVVVCKNCGAKYQLDDSDDINSFECSICTGSLEELDGSNKTKNSQYDSEGYENSYNQNYESDSVIVCCQNCGLKFKLDKSEDIREFECVSCDGSLRYLDDELNELYGLSPLSEIVDDPNHEVEIIDENENINSSIFNSSFDSTTDEIVVEHGVPESGLVDEIVVEHGVDEIDVVEESNVETIENPIHEVEVVEGFEKVEVESLEENIDSNLDSEVSAKSEEDNEEVIDNNVATVATSAVTTGAAAISENISGSENTADDSNIIKRTNKEPRSLHRKPLSQEENNKINESKKVLTFNSIEEYEEYKLTLFRTYDTLKESLKKEYISDLDKQVSSRSRRPVINKQDSNISPQMEYGEMSYKNLVKSRKEPTSKTYLIPIVIGIVVIIAGIVIFILTKQMLILILLALGILLIVLGIVMNINKEGAEVRSKIIRERLEELPEDFYLFYFTKPPYAKDGLNHVVVGPTGIYTILTQRYASKEDKNKQRADAEIDDLIAGPSDIKNYMDNRNRLELTDGYDDNQTRFQFGNEEIQFDYNSKIKHKSLTLNEDLAIFLDKSGFSGVYIEPLIGFINNDVAIINVVLTNEDLFMDELLNKIANGPRRLDPWTVMRIAGLLSKYSVNCALEN